MQTSIALTTRTGYLGPAGSWTHQAAIEQFGHGAALVPLERAALFEAYRTGAVERICVPVTTSLVGATPYLADVLALPAGTVVAEYPRMLGYSLLARPGATLAGIRTVLAHPVALEEARPWLDMVLPHAKREQMPSGGAAVQAVATGASTTAAALGPPMAAALYGLQPVAERIEEGPHNVTQWWVLGHATPAPTGCDKTAFVLEGAQAAEAIQAAGLTLLGWHSCPARGSAGTPCHLVEVAGHRARDARVQRFAEQPGVRWLGSYPHQPIPATP